MINVMIADDQEIIRQSLEIAVNNRSDMRVVCSAENGKQTVELAKKHKPDVLLMDIRMPVFNGVECIKILKEKRVKSKIIVLTTFDDDEYIFEALKNGASGYLLKGIALDELIKSIRIVVNGGSLISPDVTTKVLELFSNLAKADYTNKVENKLLASLNSSEQGIIKLIGRGLSNKEITYELGISEGTVRNYISHILSALNLKNRTQIAIFAVQSGLVVQKINQI